MSGCWEREGSVLRPELPVPVGLLHMLTQENLLAPTWEEMQSKATKQEQKESEGKKKKRNMNLTFLLDQLEHAQFERS